eukprot:403343876
MEGNFFLFNNPAANNQFNQNPHQMDQQFDASGQQFNPDLLGTEPANIMITNCFELAQRPEIRLSSGCKIINDFLRGGFLSKRLYEIYGESGSGKTQLAIQLMLNSILPLKNGGLGGKSLFVITGKHLNEKRFNEMKEYFLIEHQGLTHENAVKDNIIMNYCKTIEEYNKVFLNLVSRIQQENVKLVIIDNIHNVCDNFIKSEGSIDFLERSRFIQKHSKLLKKLAYQYDLTIILMNNVVADVSQDNSSKGFFDGKSRGQSITPSLGLQWTNCINERIHLKKKGTNADNIRRTIVIDKSSYMRKSELDFEIINNGIRGKH